MQPDLAICEPWPALRAYVDSVDLDALDFHAHRLVPYVVLLIKAVDMFKAAVRIALARAHACARAYLRVRMRVCMHSRCVL